MKEAIKSFSTISARVCISRRKRRNGFYLSRIQSVLQMIKTGTVEFLQLLWFFKFSFITDRLLVFHQNLYTEFKKIWNNSLICQWLLVCATLYFVTQFIPALLRGKIKRKNIINQFIYLSLFQRFQLLAKAQLTTVQVFPKTSTSKRSFLTIAEKIASNVPEPIHYNL